MYEDMIFLNHECNRVVHVSCNMIKGEGLWDTYIDMDACTRTQKCARAFKSVSDGSFAHARRAYTLWASSFDTL